MSAAANIRIEYLFAESPPLDLTLLELVEAVNDVTDDEVEVVATVRNLLQTGRVRLCGNFRGASISTFS